MSIRTRLALGSLAGGIAGICVLAVSVLDVDGQAKATQSSLLYSEAKRLFDEAQELVKQGKCREAEAKFYEVILKHERAKEWVARSCVEVGKLREDRYDHGSALFDYRHAVSVGFADQTGEPLRTAEFRHACLCARTGRTAEAQACLAKHPEADPAWIREVRLNLAYRVARNAYEKQDYPSAMSGYKEVMESCPDRRLVGTALLELGWCYERINQIAQMSDCLQTFIAQWPTHPYAPFALATLARHAQETGNTSQAETWLGHLRERYPDSHEGRFALVTLSGLREQSGKQDEAEQLLKLAVEAYQDKPKHERPMLERLADFYARHGRNDEALGARRKAAEKSRPAGQNTESR